MKNSHRLLATFALIWLLLASSAMAGGRSGTKIKVRNRSAFPIAVGVDIVGASTLYQFTTLGARFLNPGYSKNVKVPAGEHTVQVVDALSPVFPPKTLIIDVKKGKTVTVIYQNGVLTVE